MYFNVNDYCVHGTPMLKRYITDIIKKAREDDSFTKDDLLEFLDSMVKDSSCPLSWDDGIIVRKNASQ